MDSWLKALKLNEEINDFTGMATNLNGIGVAYIGQGDYQQAIDYFLQAKKLNEQMSLKEILTGQAHYYICSNILNA